MTEADLTQLLAMNRQTFIGWITASVLFTMATFFLAYVIRGTPVYVRAAVFAVFLVGSCNFFMAMTITNEGFLSVVKDLGAVGAQGSFAKGILDVLGGTNPALPVWARIGSPLILLLNLLVGFHLLILEKWER